MQETLIWTYTQKEGEQEAFEAHKAFLGCWLYSESKDLRLLIFKQKCVEFRIEGEGVKITFIKRDDADCSNSPEVEELDLEGELVLFHHDWKSIPGSELIPRQVIVLDYSSSDQPDYAKMLAAVRNAQSKPELVEIARYWRDFYRANFRKDPLLRLKRQALNLFTPLNFALQQIRHLWQEKEFYHLKKLLEEITEEWKGSPPLSHSPASELARLWYLIAGSKLNWKQMELTPPRDMYLPEDRSGTELCLSGWIKNNFSERALQKLAPWKELLQLAGLQPTKTGFTVKRASGIVALATSLEKQVNSQQAEGWEGFFPPAGNEHDPPGAPVKPPPDFFEWYRALNAAFDQLLEGKPHEPQRTGHQL